ASQLLLRPQVVFADEPTTALDPLVQHKTLGLLVQACRAADATLVLISHDLGVVYRYAQDVHVLDAGRVVEAGPASDIIANPKHSYTRRLLEASPALENAAPAERSDRPGDVVVRVRDLKLSYPNRKLFPWSFKRARRALSGVSFELRAGQVTTLIGGSGSGKSSIARALLGLVSGPEGQVERPGVFHGEVGDRTVIDRMRASASLVFQDAYASLDPRFRVSECVAEGLPKSERACEGAADKVEAALGLCELPCSYLNRYPHELSGGERQRVAIARALIRQPDCLIADEPVSALDLAVQKSILTLLGRLRDELGLAVLLITHDMSVVRSIADDILVLRQGRVVERGGRADIFEAARHPYTIELLQAAPKLVIEGGRYRLDTFAPDTVSSEEACWNDASDPFEPEPSGYELAYVSKTHAVAIDRS
ncbi:MAG: ATP-binding cassette domain-containing protein, partial [Caulobacterales bacterium]|nr:ATP-binding cassette domain-containing protein [Caulobacterales bacterium]